MVYVTFRPKLVVRGSCVVCWFHLCCKKLHISIERNCSYTSVWRSGRLYQACASISAPAKFRDRHFEINQLELRTSSHVKVLRGSVHGSSIQTQPAIWFSVQANYVATLRLFAKFRAGKYRVVVFCGYESYVSCAHLASESLIISS